MTTRPHPQRAQLLAELYDGLDRKPIDEMLEALADALDQIRADWPAWARSLLDLLEAADTGQNGSGGRPNGISDPTTGAVMRREELTRRRADVLGYVDDAVHAARAARNLMASTARTANAAQLVKDLAAQRCTGGMGMPGCDEWGDPTCTDLGGRRRDGLCDRHYMRRHRWQAGQTTTDTDGRYR
jgi:hypothetical protein